MDEIFQKMQAMMGDVFEQGMAYQRMLEAQDDFNTSAAKVQEQWLEIRSELEPAEDEKVN